jgi:two-component system nitrate/nitrite response regulator NarL
VSTVISVVVGDDHPIFLDALGSLLEQRSYRVTLAVSVSELAAAVARLQPHVALVDRYFGAEDSMAAIADMVASSGQTKVLVVSADPDAEGVLAALRAGASGYLHKSRGISVLTAAITRVLRGEVVVDVPRVAMARQGVEEDDARRLTAFLTPREWQCLSLLVEGLDTAQMARRFGVSRATVRTHVQALLTKLGVHSRLEAASLATRYRLLGGRADGGSSPDAREG